METCPAKIPKADTNDICKTCVEVDPTKPLWKNNDCQACTANDGGLFWDGEKCAANCPDTKPLYDENKICRACDANKDKGANWDPMTKQCVSECPKDRALKDQSGTVCKTCAEADAATPFWDSKNSKCISCAESNIKTPVWDTTDEKCRACDTTKDSGKDKWDPMTGACASSCTSG